MVEHSIRNRAVAGSNPAIGLGILSGTFQFFQGKGRLVEGTFLWAWLDKDEDVRIAAQVISHWGDPALPLALGASPVLSNLD